MRFYNRSFIVLVFLIIIVIILGCGPQPAPPELEIPQPPSGETNPAIPTPTVIAPPEVSPCVSPCGVVSLGLVGVVLGIKRRKW